MSTSSKKSFIIGGILLLLIAVGALVLSEVLPGVIPSADAQKSITVYAGAT